MKNELNGEKQRRLTAKTDGSREESDGGEKGEREQD